MSAFWHWWIIGITLLNIFGCVWLIWWAAQKKQVESESGEKVGHVWDDDLTELNHPMPRWWLGLFYITIVFALVYLALYPGLGNFAGVLGWTQVGQHSDQVAELDERRTEFFSKFDGRDVAALMTDDDALQTGARVFAHNCALCHGSDARGATGFPNLADDAWQWGGSHEQVLTSILDGREGVMPALASALGDDGAAVAAYVYHMNGRELAHIGRVTMARGEQHYQQFCAMCHGPNGKGNIALGAPDLTDDAWLYGGSIDAIQTSVRDGRHGKMPAHKRILSETQARLVAAYILALDDDER